VAAGVEVGAGVVEAGGAAEGVNKIVAFTILAAARTNPMIEDFMI
jgi:hypothetical protein